MDGVADLDFLRFNDFRTLPFEQQFKIIESGRPTPTFCTVQKNGARHQRSFNNELYKRTEWLTGSAKQNKLFCWPCLLFDDKASSNTNWTTTGHVDSTNMSRSIETHGKSQNHITASIKLQLFGKVRRTSNDEAAVRNVKRHNQEVTKNRDILKKLITAVSYLGRQEQASRDHDESATSLNRGQFVELVNAFAELDSAMAEQLGSSTVFTGMSSTIQDELVQSIAEVIQREIDSEISSAPFISVQVDTDISCKCQLSIIVRYVNDKGVTCERFLGFIDVSAKRNAEAIAAVVMETIGKYDPSAKLICQSYDGTSCMSGQRGGVQALVKTQCPYALFIHCYAHKLNVVLAQGVSNIQEANVFFAAVDSFHDFFTRSCKRTAMLTEVDNSIRVPGGCVTGWNFKSRAVHAIHEGQRSLNIVFDRIIAEPGWDNTSIAQSTALKQKLKEFMFVFLLGVFQAIFGITEPLFQALQSTSLDNMRNACVQVEDTQNALKAIRSTTKFQTIYDNTIQTVGCEDQRLKRDHHADNDPGLQDHYRRLYYELIDGITLHMGERFADMKSLCFFRLLDHSLFPTYFEKFPYEDFTELMMIKVCPFFDEQRIKNELQVVYADASFHKPPGELLQSLVKEELVTALPELCKLLKLVLTIPVTSTSAGRPFSCLKRIKTYLRKRNSCGQERLAHLTKMSMEASVLHELKARGVFYDRVIDCFATCHHGREEDFIAQQVGWVTRKRKAEEVKQTEHKRRLSAQGMLYHCYMCLRTFTQMEACKNHQLSHCHRPSSVTGNWPRSIQMAPTNWSPLLPSVLPGCPESGTLQRNGVHTGIPSDTSSTAESCNLQRPGAEAAEVEVETAEEETGATQEESFTGRKISDQPGNLMLVINKVKAQDTLDPPMDTCIEMEEEPIDQDVHPLLIIKKKVAQERLETLMGVSTGLREEPADHQDINVWRGVGVNAKMETDNMETEMVNTETVNTETVNTEKAMRESGPLLETEEVVGV